MARPLKPLVKGGGYYPSNRWTPLVYRGGYATANGGGEQPDPVEKTASGAIVHITDALAAPVSALSVAIEPVQNLHGYDSPWPAGGGVNILDDAFESGSLVMPSGGETPNPNYRRSQDFIPVAPSTQYYVKASSGVFIKYYDENQAAVSSVWDVQELNNVVITTSATTKYIKVVFPATMDMSDFCINYPATYHDYAPYSNICPISGWTGANVTRTGVNVWDEETESGAISASMGTPSANAAFTRSKNFCPIKPGLTYFRGAGTVADCALFFYRKDKSYIGVKYLGTVQPFDAPADAYFFKLHFSGTTYGNNISINYPATDTSYHAYSGATYSITFPSEAGTVYGGTLDVTTGKLTVDRAIFTLNGNENWVATPGYNNRFTLSADSSRQNNGVYADNISNYLVPTLWGVESYSFGLRSDGSIYISLDATGATMTAAEFKAYLAENPLTVCYKLATPIEVDLTPTEVRTLIGENNVWADTGDVTVTYLADGNASDVEALGILLGGRYTPSDDVTDKEALDIILGGTE